MNEREDIQNKLDVDALEKRDPVLHQNGAIFCDGRTPEGLWVVRARVSRPVRAFGSFADAPQDHVEKEFGPVEGPDMLLLLLEMRAAIDKYAEGVPPVDVVT